MREGVAMKKEELRKLILTAKGAVEADVVIKNCKVVNVFTGEIQEGDIAISGDQIRCWSVSGESGSGCRRQICRSRLH